MIEKSVTYIKTLEGPIAVLTIDGATLDEAERKSMEWMDLIGVRWCSECHGYVETGDDPDRCPHCGTLLGLED